MRLAIRIEFSGFEDNLFVGKNHTSNIKMQQKPDMAL